MLFTSLVDHLAGRRQFLQSAAGLGAAGLGAIAMPGLTGEAKAAGHTTINFEDPAENLKAYIKLTANLDPTVETCGWFGGTLYANIGVEKMIPLVGVEGLGVMRVEPQGNNTYRVFNREFAVYTDPKTGEYLEDWVNPYTEERVKVWPIQNHKVMGEVAPIRKQDFDGTIVEFPFKPPWIIQGDKAFSLLELHAAFPNSMTPEEWPRESAGPINKTSEMFNRMTTLSDLADPDTSSADYVGTWVRLGPWLPWMLMGQLDGHIVYRSFMNKNGPVENVPEKLRAYMEKNYPEFLEAPASSEWGKPNDSSFSVYMEENEPQPPSS
jgi:hypothetical protein